jgi:DNA modification methylase
MTSPPFGLVRKKSYGNQDATSYLQWFRPFAEGFKRVLRQSGSLVIDIGGSWNRGEPTRSLYHFDLLIMLCREFGFYLCQEHYWWNPSKLPTPAEWVNVRRVRVKDAVNCVWWLSPTPWPKANNRRVLAPYSDAMHELLKNGYKPSLRPSGHDISNKFRRDNGGAVPPNLLAVANTESNGRYQDYCRDHGLPIHPARYPAGIPEYFIRFLTDPGDLVVDPFAGSCVTGEVCEALGRNWVCCDTVKAYLEGALARFQNLPPEAVERPRNNDSRPTESRCPSCGGVLQNDWIKSQAKKLMPNMYTIPAPVTRPIDEHAVPLFLDGGKIRPPHIKRTNGTNGSGRAQIESAVTVSQDDASHPAD